jgi:hypothetical protein
LLAVGYLPSTHFASVGMQVFAADVMVLADLTALPYALLA